jgi:hypothetical protein
MAYAISVLPEPEKMVAGDLRGEAVEMFCRMGLLPVSPRALTTSPSAAARLEGRPARAADLAGLHAGDEAACLGKSSSAAAA